MRCRGAHAPAAASTRATICALRVDYIVAMADDGRTEERNLQLLCGYCRRVKRTKGKFAYRSRMVELRANNVSTGVMIDERPAKLTGKRLASYHRGGLPA